MSFIPGMTGAVSMRDSIPPLLQTIEKIAHTLSFTDSIAWPSGHQEGDLVLLFDWSYVENDGGFPNTAVPVPAFTQLVNQTGNSGEIDPPNQGKTRAQLFYRILDGTESGFITNLMNGNRREGAIAFLFRGDLPITSVSMQESIVNVSISGFDEQEISSGSGAVPIIVYEFGAADVGGTLGWSVNTPPFDELVSNPGDMISGYKIYNRGDTPFDHTVDGFSVSGSSSPGYGPCWAMGYLQVR